MKEEQFLRQLRAAFSMETEERLASMSENLLLLEKMDDTEARQPLIEGIYRDAHSLKGAARAVDFQDIETVCQAFESLLVKIKNGESLLHPLFFDLAYNVIDCIGRTMNREDIAENVYLDIVEELDTFAGAKIYADRPRGGLDSFPADLAFSDDLDLCVTDEEIEIQNAAIQKDDADEHERNLPGESGVPHATADGGGKEQSPFEGGTSSPAQGAQEMPGTRMKNGGSVRVATEKLDRLLLQAEEMVTLKMLAGEDSVELAHVLKIMEPGLLHLRQVDSDMRSVRKQIQQEEQAGHDHEYLKSMSRVLGYVAANEALLVDVQRQLREMIRIQTQNLYQINRQVDEFLENVKTIAMLPFSTLFTLFPRMVRDIAREQGKEVHLVLTGDDVEVDRRILEELKDVLVHLLRNAVDHGLEDAKERCRAGKRATGELAVHVARREGNRIEVRVEDDGRGINLDTVRTRAVQTGMVSAEEVLRLSDKEVMEFVFRSGMSTSPIITEISGRGLGMSIVQEKIDFLGGTYALENTPGRGCSFSMRVPITLSTFKGFRVRLGDQMFILPTTRMEQAVRISPCKISIIEHRETMVFRGRTISLVDLGKLLGVVREKDQDHVAVVVLRAADRFMGFKVDALLGEHEVLVKSLGPQLKRVRNVAAATVLRSGEVALILNVHDLMESGARTVSSTGQAVRTGVTERQRTLLVVEDSITSRMLLKNVLEGAGYKVLTAVDGRAGLTTLHAESVDLVISDVEMPRMNGFEMTGKIREDATLNDLPVVLVTSLSSTRDRERGIEVGANAYILKSDFDQSDLLRTIERLIL